MSLKLKLKSKEEIPAGLESHYVERDGAWMLDAEGVVEKTKLDEFRANNVALLKERDELKQRFAGIDPDEVRKLADEKRKLEEAQQVKAGEIEKVLENRLRSAKAEWDKQFSSVASERDALNSRLVSIQIDQAVVSEATKRGLRPTAIPDITSRARTNFKLVNGVPQAFEADGQTVRVGRDGVAPLTLAEWIDAQVSEAPHLFESNAGSGAAGNGSGGGGGAGPFGENPWKRETFNLTKQGEIVRKDPSRAKALMSAAGKG
jgi:hypothetical protein